MESQGYHYEQKSASAGAPIIFARHGTGGDEHQFFELTQSVAPHAGVVSPRGPVSEGGAARFFRRTAEGVYDMDDLRAQTSRMAAFVQDLAGQNPDSPRRAFGHSNGANILACVVITHPHLFERSGLLHRFIPWSPSGVPALGEKADGRATTVAKTTELPKYTLEATSGEQHLEALAKSLDKCGALVRADIDTAADAGEQDTADIFTGVSHDRQDHADRYRMSAEVSSRPHPAPARPAAEPRTVKKPRSAPHPGTDRPGEERPMIKIHEKMSRGRIRTGWLDSHHIFSFGNFNDPTHTVFGNLRVVNEDRIMPGSGFPKHRSRHGYPHPRALGPAAP